MIGSEARRRTLMAWAVALAGAVVTTALFRSLRHDDAFITFQYARNLAEGRGLVFNPGERQLGFTSPLHALLLSLLCWLGGADVLPTLAVAVGSLGLALQSVSLAVLLRPTSPVLAALVGASVLAGLADPHSALALETNLFAGLVLATLWALEARRPVAAGILLGASFLVRYDAALLVPLVLGISAWRERRVPKATALCALAVVFPWLLVATAYYGSFLPNTFFAKLKIASPLDYLGHYLGYFAALPWRGLGFPALAWATPLLWLAGGWVVFRSARSLWPFLAFCALLLLSYAWIGPPPAQHWHQYPTALALSVLAVLGAFGLWAERVAFRPLGFGLGAATVAWIGFGAVRFAQRVPDEFWLGRRDRAYSEVAGWVGRHVRSDATFLADEVGTLGFRTRLRMIDPFGLLNPTNDYPKTLSLGSLLGVIDDYSPGLILVSSPEAGKRIAQARGYRIVQVFPWLRPWSTVLIRDPSVLRDPGEIEQLSQAVSALDTSG